MKQIYFQLNRLDPANRSLAVHGFVDKDLSARVSCLEDCMNNVIDCPAHVGIEHVHKGKKGSREVTHVSLIEFRSNADREKAFEVLSSEVVKDEKDGSLMFKRARSSVQKQRNDFLVKACDLIKKKAPAGKEVKIDWKNRKVLCQGEDAFIQDRELSGGSFANSFQGLSL